MKITLKRIAFKSTYTIGKMYIDEQYFCDTLEDFNRDINHNGIFDNNEKKIYGETAIPFGTYEVIVNYSNKFKRELPLLLNVPYFEGIRIHRGNTSKDTLGCILVGENKKIGMVLNSAPYEIKLTSLIKQELKKGNKVYIEII